MRQLRQRGSRRQRKGHRLLACHQLLEKDCDQCESRQAGVQLWDARQTRECEALYTTGASTMAQTYFGSRNIVVMMPTKEFMQVMQESGKAGRDYRALQKRLRPQIEHLHKKMVDVHQDITQLQVKITQSKVRHWNQDDNDHVLMMDHFLAKTKYSSHAR
jgi:hypothetical protein